MGVAAGGDAAPEQRTLSPDLAYRTLAAFEAGMGQSGCLLKGEEAWLFAPKLVEANARTVFPYLTKAYGELRVITGVDTEYVIAVYAFPKGHKAAFGGTSRCAIYYDDANLRLGQQEEWVRHRVPHVSGYIEGMAHNFVAATGAQFGWEMLGWSIGAKVAAKVAGNPIHSRQLRDTRKKQTTTFHRYRASGNRLPDDVLANLVDRVHAYVLWQCEKAYGDAFWRDFFAEVAKNRQAFERASQLGGDEARNARYQRTIACFDRLRGVKMSERLAKSGISRVVDVKSFRPTEAGWNRRLE